MSTKPILLYILAPSFSGSTLLTYLLAQHPRVATVGELKATRMGSIDEYRCSCGEPMRTCEFWQALGGKPKAALNYTVTIGVEPHKPVEVGAPVTDKRLRFINTEEGA